MTAIKYQCHEGIPSGQILQWLRDINQQIFQFNETSEHLTSCFQNKQKIVIHLAFQQTQPVGFKAGFETEPWCFESWRGGVLPSVRRQGIAQELMQRQHQWCMQNNFRCMKTVTNSDNTPMLMLNLKNGFEIVGSFVNRRKKLKILQEKWLLQQ